MSLFRKSLVALCLLSSLGGCGGGSGNTSAFQTTTGQYESLQFTATTRSVYRRGENVTVTLVIQNTSTQPYVLTFGGCVPDTAQVQQNGQMIATFDDKALDTGCTGDIKKATFAPGETRSFAQVWYQQVPEGVGVSYPIPSPAGKYQIQSGIPALDGGTPRGAAPLTITIQ